MPLTDQPARLALCCRSARVVAPHCSLYAKRRAVHTHIGGYHRPVIELGNEIVEIAEAASRLYRTPV
jgi:hypothetical protein